MSFFVVFKNIFLTLCCYVIDWFYYYIFARYRFLYKHLLITDSCIYKNRCPYWASVSHLYTIHSLNDFSVLRTLEIVTPIRIPDYRPTCSCSFTSRIKSPSWQQAVRKGFSWVSLFYQMISTLSKYRIRISAQFSIPSLVVSRIMW